MSGGINLKALLTRFHSMKLLCDDGLNKVSEIKNDIDEH